MDLDVGTKAKDLREAPVSWPNDCVESQEALSSRLDNIRTRSVCYCVGKHISSLCMSTTSAAQHSHKRRFASSATTSSNWTQPESQRKWNNLPDARIFASYHGTTSRLRLIIGTFYIRAERLTIHRISVREIRYPAMSDDHSL